MKCLYCQKEIPNKVTVCPFCNLEKKTEKKIRDAGNAAFIIAAITAVASIFHLIGMNLTDLLDAALAFFLGWGIKYYFSRGCTIILLIYFLFTKTYQLITISILDNTSISSPFIFVAIIFIYIFILGISGTFAFHRF